MYVENILLTLMVTTLYLAPGNYGSSNIMYPTSDETFGNILKEANDQGKLSVMYVVKNNKFDSLFNELASKYTNTVFIKLDLNVLKFWDLEIKFEVDKQPGIMFEKYGINEQMIYCNDKHTLENLITHRNDLSRDDLKKIQQEQQQSKEGCQLRQGLKNVIVQPQSASELSSLLSFIDDFRQLAVLYYVKDDTYDSIFKDLTNLFDNTIFIKLDTSENRFDVDAEENPIITFHKYTLDEPRIVFENKDTLINQIQSRDNLGEDDYINLVEEESINNNGGDQSGKSGNQENSSYDIKYANNRAEHVRLLSSADEKKKLSVTYYAKDNTYDTVFKELAKKYKNTCFIKVDTSTFDFDGQKFDPSTLPIIQYHKYRMDERMIGFNNREEIKTQIEHRKNLNINEFKDLIHGQSEVVIEKKSG